MGFETRVILSSLLAGVFEETTRYFMVRYRFHNKDLLGEVLAVGLGWGVMEALIIYVLQALIASTYYGYTWIDLMPGAIERNWAIMFHVAMTLLITYAILRGSVFYGILLTGSLHMLTGLLAGVVLAYTSDPWLIEALLGVIVVGITLPIYYKIPRRLRTGST